MPLSILLLLPVAGACVAASLPVGAAGLRRATLATTLAILCGALGFAFAFDPSLAEPQFVESHVWNPRLGTSFSLGVDGLALSMVLLTALLFFVAALASHAVVTGARLYFSLLLLLEAAVLGVFMARDWSLFYVFWELTLIPLFFMIERLGGENRNRAALNFVLYTMGGSVFMLIALLLLYDASPAHSFGMAEIAAGVRNLPPQTQLWIFLGLLVGFGVKMPIFPFHGWLPLAHVEAPSPISILLSGVLLKMGAYGLIRAAATLPAAALWAADGLAWLACVNLIYGGVLAWRQRDLKSMVAYSSISHMGVVLLGIATLNATGLNGAMLQMTAHGLAAGMLFLLVGSLYERTGCRDVGDYENVAARLPRFGLFLSLGLLAAIGLPGSAGFVAELHVLIAGFDRWGYLVVALSLAVLVSAAYGFRTLDRLTQGAPCARCIGVSDLRKDERLAAVLLLVPIIGIGIFPTPWLRLVAGSAAALAGLF